MDTPEATTASETTTVWEYLFPEVKKETAKASQKVREDLSSFLSKYSQGLDELYLAIDQNPCRTWGISTSPVGLKYPFPTERTIDEFFDTHDDEIIYPIKLLTNYITYINRSIQKAETEYYPKIALFGETIEDIKSASEVLDNECGIPTGDLEILISDFFPVLQDLSNFLPEYISVGQKFVEYIIWLYSPNNPLFTGYFQNTVLYSAFQALGRFLTSLYTLENLINDNDALNEGWEHLRRMTFVIKSEPGNYNAQADDLNLAETAMSQIHRIVFSGSLVGKFINVIVPFSVRPNIAYFASQLERYLEEESASYVRLQSDGKFSDKENDICDLTLLTHIYTFFSKQPRKKIASNIWNAFQTAPVIKLYHFVTFSVVQYMQENMPGLVAMVDKDAARVAYQKTNQFLANHDGNLGALVSRSFMMFSQWQATCHNQLLMGLNLAYFIRSSISRTIDLHFAFSKPIDSSNVEHLGRLIGILKAIQMTFFQNQAGISHNLPTQVDQIVKNLHNRLENVASTLRKKNYRNVRTKISLILSLAHHCIRSFTSEYSSPCLSVISDLFGSKSLAGLGFTHSEIFGTLRSLELLGHYNDHIDRSTDVSFMFDSRELFNKFLHYAQRDPRRVMFHALAINDIGDLFKDQPALYAKLEDYFVAMLRAEYINPILSDLEKELRFHTHQHLDVSERNPLRKSYSQFDKFLQTPPFKILGRVFDMQYEASYYFTRIFYNETTVAPQVWETYTEMANLLKRLYGVSVLECHIPGAMMQQDIDVLEIMRNISVFVSCYNYDLNSQVFVQRADNSHHIAIVGIPHIFSSYRCHGIGIMNTTVDFTYRFLKSKFNIFSRFLFDDTVKSRLFTDITWFEQHKEEVDGLWPYAHAEKFVNDMKRIGASAQGFSALDHFRILITEIGNALGFVRMVKSGGTRFLNNAIGFVYDEDDELSFKAFAEEVQLPAHTVTATDRLDGIVGKLKELFGGGESFFKMLVDVFSGPFRDKKNVHLQAFYAILPALTLCYIEHIMVLKDKAQKQNKNASFSDDGFPMGIAYILKLLNQDALFDSIHWFQALRKHAEEERNEVNRTSSGRSMLGFFTGDNKQTVKLALQMIDRRIKECELLETTVHSARILFN